SVVQQAERPDARLRFVFHESDLEDALRSAVASSPTLASRVEILGAVPAEQLRRIYEQSDLFVVGSHREGSGYAALEGMACGVVPVLTDIAPFRWLVDDGRAGALWPVGDAAALAEAIAAVASRPLEPQRRQARARFEERF